MYKVNIEKGKELMKLKEPDLVQASDTALELSKNHTTRLVKKEKEKK